MAVALPPVIEGMARRAFFKHLFIGFSIAIMGGELFWHGHVKPRQILRTQYYKEKGVEFVHPFA